MIWVVLAIGVLLTLLILAPAFVGGVEADDGEIQTYFDQIDALERDPDMSGPVKAAARLTLERQILKAQSTGSGAGGTVLATIATIALLGGGGLIYSQIGHPETLAPAELSETDTLLAELEQRLATDRREDPIGWTLYARTLASLGRTQEAVMAYDVALQLDDNPGLRAEAQSVLRGPTADDVAAAMEMSEQDRSAMIRGMVDSLSARLIDNPQDAPGWVRLLRARIVLGDSLDTDIATIRAAYTDRPAVSDQILREAGVPAPGAPAEPVRE